MSNQINTIPRIIHQIFIDIGKGDLSQAAKGRFYQSHRLTKKYCQKAKIKYHLWNKGEIEDLVAKVAKGRYLDFYHQLRQDIQRIDFAKYLMLYQYGGIYLDLDVHIIEERPSPKKNSLNHLFQLDFIFVRWNDSDLPYNAILGASRKNPIFREIIKESRRSYLEKSKMSIYKKWTGRFVFQTTGHYMLKRVLKRNEIDPSQFHNILYIISKGREITSPNPIFYDTNESVWYDATATR